MGRIIIEGNSVDDFSVMVAEPFDVYPDAAKLTNYILAARKIHKAMELLESALHGTLIDGHTHNDDGLVDMCFPQELPPFQRRKLLRIKDDIEKAMAILRSEL